MPHQQAELHGINRVVKSQHEGAVSFLTLVPFGFLEKAAHTAQIECDRRRAGGKLLQIKEVTIKT